MTLVMLPPIGLDEHCWDWLEVGNMHRVTYPGHGGRPEGEAPWSLATIADETAAATSGSLDLVGVSMGGMVAQHIALRHPARVRSMLLACTTGASHPAVMLERAREVETGGIEPTLRTTLARWFSPDLLRDQPNHPAVRYAVATLRAISSRAMANGWRAIAGHNVLDRLGEVACPVACVAGHIDVATPVSTVAEIWKRLKRARLSVLAGPHMLHLENPAAFSAAVKEHLTWAAATDGGALHA